MPPKNLLTYLTIFVLGWIIFATYMSIASKNELKLAENYNTQFLQLHKKGEFQKALPFAEKAFDIRMRKLGWLTDKIPTEFTLLF